MPSKFDLLRQAILERKHVRANYDGYYREMCPHLMGLKDGVRHVLSFQFAGDSSRGLPPGGQWRCMDFDGLTILSIQDGPWHTGTSHTKPQSCIDEIEVAVPY
jgi:hypothetical protein